MKKGQTFKYKGSPWKLVISMIQHLVWEFICIAQTDILLRIPVIFI